MIALRAPHRIQQTMHLPNGEKKDHWINNPISFSRFSCVLPSLSHLDWGFTGFLNIISWAMRTLWSSYEKLSLVIFEVARRSKSLSPDSMHYPGAWQSNWWHPFSACCTPAFSAMSFPKRQLHAIFFDYRSVLWKRHVHQNHRYRPMRPRLDIVLIHLSI